jgi:tetratricopeptide (TPR) repeat protein
LVTGDERFLTAAQEIVMTSRVFVVFLLAASAAAQIDAGTPIRQVRVRLAFVNGVCDAGTQVVLMGTTGPVSHATANQQCEAEFFNVPAGTYRLSVSGQTIAEADGGTVEMAPAKYAEYEVKVRRPGDVEHKDGAPSAAFVAASDLAVPARAQKEFDKADELITKQNFAKAIDRLNSAIAIYPNYANAYNNLGVIYARLGDREHERGALQKAISINDHFAPAYVNLGRMDIATGNFPAAEGVLTQASSYDPTDAMAFVLLSYSEFMDKHFDEAIVNSRKAHALSGPHSDAHLVAARSFEQKRDAVNAAAELEQFLKEEPTGTRADAARKELEAVRAIRQ